MWNSENVEDFRFCAWLVSVAPCIKVGQIQKNKSHMRQARLHNSWKTFQYLFSVLYLFSFSSFPTGIHRHWCKLSELSMFRILTCRRGEGFKVTQWKSESWINYLIFSKLWLQIPELACNISFVVQFFRYLVRPEKASADGHIEEHPRKISWWRANSQGAQN